MKLRFRPFFIYFVAILVGGSVLSVSGKPKKIQYEISPLEGAARTYRIRVSFTGNADGKTVFLLPNEWGGQTELYRAIKAVRPLSKGTSLNPSAKPHEFVVTHRPGQKIVIEYDITQDYEGPLTNGNRYRPVVQDRYVHLIGETALARPDWNEDETVSATVRWNGLPKQWNVASSLGIGRGEQSGEFPASELGRMVLVAGDFRIISTNVKGKPLHVAVRQSWQFADSELAEMVRRVVESQRKFWNDFDEPYYLVTLVQTDEGPNASSYGGTGLRNSFALFATPNSQLSQLRTLLAHEYFHNWNPMQIGKLADPEQSVYWLSEGFTEFYTYQLLLRGGLITEDEHIEYTNSMIRDYYLLPTRNEPNERIVKDFWNSRDVQRLPYLRGFVFALNLNAVIREASGGKHSLDDVMHELRNNAGHSLPDLSFERLATAVSKYANGRDISADLEKYITKGELIVPNADSLGPDVVPESREIAVFELGLDSDVLLSKRLVAGVKPGTAAFDAGLRDGQKVVGGISIYFGDTTRELQLKIKDEAGDRTVKYLPVALERVRVPQFVRKQPAKIAEL